jgi:peptidoglycan/LPS O-acetylase OafA/YrhL
MGFYRLLLAYLVVSDHAGGFRVYGLYPGAIAVVSFFLLSGYVMTALVDRHYSDFSRVGLFYLDRAARLFPQFLFYSLATVVAAELGLRHHWLMSAPSLPSDLAQLTLLPLNFSMWFNGTMLLPQAWSLGLEGFFYLLFPFVLLADRRLFYALGSVAIFGLAYFGRINPEMFGYRMLPGILFVFLLGSWMRKPEPALGRAPLVIAFALAGAALAAGLAQGPLALDRRVGILDVLAGLLLGLPVVYLATRARLSARFDSLAGDMSYGVFLNHNLLLPLVAGLMPGAPPLLILAALIPVSTAASYATFRFIEAPTIALRRHFRSPDPAPEPHESIPLPVGRARAA